MLGLIPGMIRGMKSLMIFLVLGILWSCGKQQSRTSPLRETFSSTDLGYFQLMNQHRLKKGLSPLNFFSEIQLVAQDHSEEMAAQGRLGHFGWRQRCAQLQDKLHAQACGEIVASGQISAESVLFAWLNSPRHRKSLEDPNWTHSAVGYALGADGKPYWTQIFLTL